MKPLTNLIGQILITLVPIYYGIVIDRITPFGIEIEFGILAVPITIIWMIAIINAINLIDGLDGLATGVSIIALSSIAFITILQGNIFVMMICVILRSEEHTSELQSRGHLVCRLLLEKKK